MDPIRPWLIIQACILCLTATLVSSIPLSSSLSAFDFDFSGRGDADAIADVFVRVLDLNHTSELPFLFELVEQCEGPRPEGAESFLCYELVSSNDASSQSIVTVRGTSGPDLAFGAAVYLRKYCSMSFSWDRAGGNQVALPKESNWPALDVEDDGVSVFRRRDISYGFNVCTESYSNVWYQFDVAADGYSASWQSLLDWMVLSGINLALAYTGQEEVYRKVYEAFGVNQSAFLAWSNGPAHLTWSRGQSMHGVGGALPPSFATQQWHLQRQILGRMRALGMVPVLPAFQGNVPPVLADLYPAANITVQPAHWGGGRAAWLDATDPLFKDIGAAVVRAIVEDFGVDEDGDGVGDATEHVYEADGLFAAGDPPWRRRRQRRRRLGGQLQESVAPPSPRRHSTAVGAAAAAEERRGVGRERGRAEEGAASYYDQDAYVHARRAFEAMLAGDSQARWFYQGWIWNNWGPERRGERLEVMAAFGAAAEDAVVALLAAGGGGEYRGGRFLVSDMWSEWAPIAADLSRLGIPYLFGALQNFGGTLYLGMSVKTLAFGAEEAPVRVPSIAETFASFPGGAGIGAFPEGIDQNPAYFTFLFDSNWLRAEKAIAEGEESMLKNRSLDAWWAKYAEQRYGLANMATAAATAISSKSVSEEATGAAIAAWQILGESVYGIDERRNATEGGFWREKAKGGLLAAPLMDDQSDAPVGHSNWYDPATLLEAWQCLVTAAHLMVGEPTDDDDRVDGAALEEGLPGTLRYDLVNVGRQVLDEVVNLQFYPALMNATSKDEAAAAGAAFLGLLADADELLCSEGAFVAAHWLGAARALANATEGASAATSESSRPGVAIASTATMADFYERMARAQITTWLPACSNASEFASGVCSIHVPPSQAGDDDDDGGDDYWSNSSTPPLEDYANKAWGGLVGHYYAARVECYLNEALTPDAGGLAARVNRTAMNSCIDALARDFQNDTMAPGHNRFGLCTHARGNTIALSRDLISKYGPFLK